MKLPHAGVKPRATAEAARDPQVRPSARTRHAVGNAAQRRMPSADVEARARDGGDWFAERIDGPGRGAAQKGTR